MGYSNYIIFGGVVLHVKNCVPFTRQKKYKQVMGKSLAQVDIIGLDDQQTELSITGDIYGTTQTNLDTNRASIQALDVASAFVLVDGLHDGTYYIVPSSLKFQDNANEDAGMKYSFSMQLVEE